MGRFPMATTILLVASLQACLGGKGASSQNAASQKPPASDQTNPTTPPPSSIKTSSLVVKSGSSIAAHLVSLNLVGKTLTLLTPEGYLLQVNRKNGKIIPLFPGGIYYAGVNCTGTQYVIPDEGNTYYAGFVSPFQGGYYRLIEDPPATTMTVDLRNGVRYADEDGNYGTCCTNCYPNSDDPDEPSTYSFSVVELSHAIESVPAPSTTFETLAPLKIEVQQ